MRIRYLRNNKKQSAKNDCKDFDIEISKANHRFTLSIIAKNDITLINAEDWLPSNVNYNDLYFLNGYQSWTDSKEFRLANRLRNIKKSPHIISKLYAMDAYGDVNFYKYSINKMHGYDVFYSKGKYESFIFNLNYKTAYLIIELQKNKKNIHLISDIKGLEVKKGDKVTILDYCFYDSFQLGLTEFNKTFPSKNINKIFGYTSWYNYFQNINETIILRDLDALDKRFNLFQIDDGYETFVGDWLDVDSYKFPNGLQPIIDKIHEKGYKAGLWLAPFVAEEKSRLFKEHPNWFALDKKGHPIKSGGNWSGHYALDIKNQAVREYIEKCLRHYMDMGVDFFKLDFLYAVAIPEQKSKTRCMAQQEAYKFLRDILKDKLILGCGANIINSMDNFDYLRIGPDVSLVFDDIFYMRLFHRERISTKVTLQNTIYRSIFDQRLFANDPDVFLLRDENIQLSKEQRLALTKINALFGSVLMTSDDIANYDDEKKQILDEALNIFENATDRTYKRRSNVIEVTYKLNNVEHAFAYNTQKGILEYDR